LSCSGSSRDGTRAHAGHTANTALLDVSLATRLTPTAVCFALRTHLEGSVTMADKSGDPKAPKPPKQQPPPKTPVEKRAGQTTPLRTPPVPLSIKTPPAPPPAKKKTPLYPYLDMNNARYPILARGPRPPCNAGRDICNSNRKSATRSRSIPS